MATLDTLSSLLGNSVADTGARNRATPSLDEAATVRKRGVAARSELGNENGVRLKRLDNILESGKPLRNDVPRGFYVDISI